MYVCMYILCMYVCMYVRMYVCMYVRMYVYMYVLTLPRMDPTSVTGQRGRQVYPVCPPNNETTVLVSGAHETKDTLGPPISCPHFRRYKVRSAYRRVNTCNGYLDSEKFHCAGGAIYWRTVRYWICHHKAPLT